MRNTSKSINVLKKINGSKCLSLENLLADIASLSVKGGLFFPVVSF